MNVLKFILPAALVLGAGVTCYSSYTAYTESLWTRDAKIHVEIAEISPKVSGRLSLLRCRIISM